MHLQVVNGRAIHVDLAESKQERQARQARAQQRSLARTKRLRGRIGKPLGLCQKELEPLQLGQE
ncbi:unnamed protein product [Effrenium voratum]|uniref:Uncharacterized protein n=1 Tax=Effrenium voratum TaxID=2562239 RepID=A0AA36J1T3_9DINO|nr:unnamed protein product [Effrenium voratum]